MCKNSSSFSSSLMKEIEVMCMDCGWSGIISECTTKDFLSISGKEKKEDLIHYCCPKCDRVIRSGEKS